MELTYEGRLEEPVEPSDVSEEAEDADEQRDEDHGHGHEEAEGFTLLRRAERMCRGQHQVCQCAVLERLELM